jgi:hypothetical protein
VQALREYVNLWVRIQSVHLQEGTPDHFLLRWTVDQKYSTSPAYHAFFVGQSGVLGSGVLHKARAPPTCKFFLWLTLLDRCWTSERLQRHNLQNNGPCALCSQETETISHLFLQCSFSREIWYRSLQVQGFHALAPSVVADLQDWWPDSRKVIPKALRKCFDTMVVLICWQLWRERNARVFDHASKTTSELLFWITYCARLWSLAGFQSLLLAS